MTQPSFVPIPEADQVRGARRLRVPEAWLPRRPAEVRTPTRTIRPGFGTPGPDQGFALRLARRLEGSLVLDPTESADDVTVGCALLASRRAALFGRAPSIHDVRLALALFGFLEPADPAVVGERSPLFRSVAHEYDAQRRLIDAVPESVLRLKPQELAGPIGKGWRPSNDG